MYIDLCAKCKQEEGTIIHAKRLRKDGSFSIVKWCRTCKKGRYDKRPRDAIINEAIPKRITWGLKKQEAWAKKAKEVELRIAAKWKPSR